MIFTIIVNTLELSFNQSSKASSLHHIFGSSKLPCSTRPTEEQFESFSWFQPRLRTIGAHCRAERISAKKKVDSID